MGTITDPYQQALLANTEHYLQAINNLADPVPGGISNTVTTNPDHPSAFTRAIRRLIADVEAIKTRPTAVVTVDQAMLNTAVRTALADPTTLAAMAKAVNDDAANRLRN